MTYLFIRIFAPVINIIVELIGLIIRRDNKILLMGAWMGEKFADNTRYLYEYLQDHKKEYELKKLIWVTRNRRTFEYMRAHGLEVYMMHDPRSFYYHLKAGVHIVCNLGFPVKGYAGDIMGQLSGNAKKINTWHGVPIKAGKTTGENQKRYGTVGKIKYILRRWKFFNGLFTPGHWDKAYYLSTGKESTKRCSVFCGIPKKQFVESGYPRNCIDKKIHDEERKVINYVKKYERSVLYVPTFRDFGSIPNPLESEELIAFLKRNKTLWIYKPHEASRNKFISKQTNDYVLYLDKEFELNSLIPHVSLVITDYSSVCYDAMNVGIPVLFYIPDYDEYLSKDRGFLFDFQSMVKDLEARNIKDLIEEIQKIIHQKNYANELIKKEGIMKDSIFSEQRATLGEIVKIINQKVGIM